LIPLSICSTSSWISQNGLGLLDHWRTSLNMDSANETSLSELSSPPNEKFDDKPFENEISSSKKHEIEKSKISSQDPDNELTTSQTNLSSRHTYFQQPRNTHRASSRKFFSVFLDDILAVLTSSWLNFGLSGSSILVTLQLLLLHLCL
jgi:hypothetical protein